jgi:hypothetical protein
MIFALRFLIIFYKLLGFYLEILVIWSRILQILQLERARNSETV